MAEIIPHLWVGSFEESYDANLLEKGNITHILNVASELNVSERVGRDYRKIAIDDDSPDQNIGHIIPLCLSYMVEAIEQEKGNVFVHCLEGRSRSVSVVLAYVTLYHTKCFVEAIRLVKEKWPRMDIHKPYFFQTMKFCDQVLYPSTSSY